MKPSTLEEFTGISFALIGLVILLLALVLTGIKISFLGIAMIVSAIIALVTGVLLVLDSKKQGPA